MFNVQIRTGLFIIPFDFHVLFLLPMYVAAVQRTTLFINFTSFFFCVHPHFAVVGIFPKFHFDLIDFPTNINNVCQSQNGFDDDADQSSGPGILPVFTHKFRFI